MTCSNKPTKKDFWFKAGETWSIVVTCRDGDGNLIDLTGAQSAEWRVASINEDESLNQLLIAAGIGSGIEISATPTTGVLTIGIPAIMQNNVVPATYRHELRIVNAEGAASVQMEGNVYVSESIFSHSFA